jgi:Nucleotidyl transferase AbiEii toxin, Type IV TA system
LLSPLQERVAKLISGLPEAQDFALAGGAALIARGDVNRLTEDLDFFSREPATVDRLLPVAVRAIREAGLDVEIVRAAPGFAWLAIEGDGLPTTVKWAAVRGLAQEAASRWIRTSQVVGRKLGCELGW